MGKNAVYKPNIFFGFKDEPTLKKIAILFDRIYVDKLILTRYDHINRNNSSIPDVMWSDIPREEIFQEINLWEFLVDKKIVCFYEPYNLGNLITLNEKEKTRVKQTELIIEVLAAYGREISERDLNTKCEKDGLSNGFMTQVLDISTRLDSMTLSENNDEEFYPIIETRNSFDEEGKKSDVIHFLLSNIPVPDESTPWEHIMDFKSDEDTRLKYLALINWINDIGKSNYTIGEIKDKYEYLYLDYKRSYEWHKIKSIFTTLEIFAAAGAAFFTSNVPLALSLASNFIKIGTSTVNLLKEEGYMPGKEIAYIYHANKEFKKT